MFHFINHYPTLGVNMYHTEYVIFTLAVQVFLSDASDDDHTLNGIAAAISVQGAGVVTQPQLLDILIYWSFSKAGRANPPIFRCFIFSQSRYRLCCIVALQTPKGGFTSILWEICRIQLSNGQTCGNPFRSDSYHNK